jgi:hypothetical protein
VPLCKCTSGTYTTTVLPDRSDGSSSSISHGQSFSLILGISYADTPSNEGFVEGIGCPAREYMLCSCEMRLSQCKGLHRQPAVTWGMGEEEIE